jgi:UDP-glucose 4-epimerase
MPQVLLTGGAGFIGSHLAQSLIRDGWEVDVVDDLSSGDRRSVPAGAQFFELDLGDESSISLLPRRPYSAVLHLAGQSSGEKSFDDPVRDFDSNARSTALLARWALSERIPAFVHASSMGVYGQPAQMPVAESTEAFPISWYGGSKLSAERTLAVASMQGLRSVSLRMFSVYGPGQNLAEMRQGMASIFLAMMLHGDPVEVRGSLDRVRDFVYVADCVKAWRSALERDVSGVFNVGTGVGTSVRQLIAELLAGAGLADDYPVVSLGITQGDQTALVADTELSSRRLGWRADTALADGIAETIRWAHDEQ